MKNIFDPPHRKEVIAFIIAILFSLDTLKWGISPLYYSLFGPLLAFLPRITAIYFSEKRPEYAENAHIAVMFILYFFTGIAFASLPDAGEIFMRIFISASFYFLGLRVEIILQSDKHSDKYLKPVFREIIFFAGVVFFIIGIFNATQFTQRWWSRIMWAVFMSALLIREVVQSRKIKDDLADNT